MTKSKKDVDIARMRAPEERPKKRRASALAAADYPSGFFTALMRQHHWPPRFEPAPAALNYDYAQIAATARRERDAVAGIGWGVGTIPMTNTPTHRAPGWLSSEGVTSRPAALGAQSARAVGAAGHGGA